MLYVKIAISVARGRCNWKVTSPVNCPTPISYLWFIGVISLSVIFHKLLAFFLDFIIPKLRFQSLGGVTDQKSRHHSIVRLRFPICGLAFRNAYLLRLRRYWQVLMKPVSSLMQFRPLGGVLDRKWHHQSFLRPHFPISVVLIVCAYLL